MGAYVSQLVLRDSVWWVDVFAHCVFTCMYMCTCVPVCVRKQLCMLTPAGASRVSYKIFCWGGGGGEGGNTSQSYNKTSPFLGGPGGMLPQKVFEI